ncbi:hypothetical protein F5X71_30560 [Nocardia brasiliensis]|uniref:Uncharacterized protein n=1 Tax=Nocardia brasiliensis TaxID=37326 RepID=A0A6G9XYS5_NOCBR|nr:hypothetical protein [Nocardia brasiliensis]QIS06074.1 hypothetical protein F5X71_30560 [Nocardia brasiliensis]
MAEAGLYTLELLQHAQGVANGVQTNLIAAKSELSNVVIQEAPSRCSE